ncbi:glycoside hydrolase family 27 protein [Skermania piniformis]
MFAVLLLVLALLVGDQQDSAPEFGPRVSAAPVPPMGWNSWNSFGCAIDESTILRAAHALADSGMRDAGYRYVIVDDCWQAPARAADGSLTADPGRFPHGMAWLGAQIHALGEKFGIYQSPRERTCAQLAGAIPGATGALGHEAQDARTFADWGVDYLKYDWCSAAGSVADQARTFARMGRALRATGRSIVFSVNPNSAHAVTGIGYDWGRVADLWRTTSDITDAWHTGCPAACPAGGALGVTDILDQQAPLWRAAGPGRWNDPDMLEVGVRGTFSLDENRAHLVMWAMLSAPLIAGNDVAAMPASVRGVLTDPDVIAIDQDRLGRAAQRVRDDGNTEVWARPLADGSVAVALLNRSDTPARIVTSVAEVAPAGALPPATSYTAFDVWAKTTVATTGGLTASVPPRAAVVYRVSCR